MPGKRILLVDYDPRSLTHTREVLEGAGFDVSTCGDGLTAIDQFKTLAPDLVLLSAMLPKMHGFEVCSNIRKLPGGEKTPVVIITDVYKGKRYRVDAINKYGATEYIEKPIEDSNLVTILQGLVQENGQSRIAIEDEERTMQFSRDLLNKMVKEDVTGASRPAGEKKTVTEKPKSKDQISKKLEESLAGLDLEVKKQKARPASEKAEVSESTSAAEKPAASEAVFTSEDLFTDVIASVERELQSEKMSGDQRSTEVLTAPPVVAVTPAPPAPAPTPEPKLEPAKAAPTPEPRAPEPTKVPAAPTVAIEMPKSFKAAEHAKKAGMDLDLEKKLSDTLSGLKKPAPAGAKPHAAAAKPPVVEPTRKIEIPKQEPMKPQPVKQEAVKPEAIKPEPAKPQPVKPEPVAAKPAPAPMKDALPAAVAAKVVEEEGINFGQYLLLEKIATGGMAELFLAKRKGVEGFEKILAIKRILPHMAENEEFVTMFIDEAKLAAQLTHHNICQIFDLGKIENAYYIAMEYVHGKDLRGILKSSRTKGKPMSVDLSVLVISKIASALDYAHRKRGSNGQPLNLVHRDVSPQNILISYEGEVKLVDFGIAKAATKAHVTQHGALKGKLLYMSPEQAWGKAVDKRSDIFSLGVVLYELLTGRPLFFDENDTEVTILEKVREARITPTREFNSRVPAELEKIVNRALKKNADDRYQSAYEMQKDLDNLFYSESYTATGASLANYVRDLFPDESHEGEMKEVAVEKEPAKPVSAPIAAAVPAVAAKPQPEPVKPKEVPAVVKPAPQPVAPAKEQKAPVAAPEAAPVPAEKTGFRDISVPDMMASQEHKRFPILPVGIGAAVLVGIVAYILFRPSSEPPTPVPVKKTQVNQPAVTPTPSPDLTTTPAKEPAVTTPVDTKKPVDEKKAAEEKKLVEQKAEAEKKKREEEARIKEEDRLKQEEKLAQQKREEEAAAAQAQQQPPPPEETKAEVQPAPAPVQETPPPQQEPVKEAPKETPKPAEQKPSVNEGDLVEMGVDVQKPEVISRVKPTYPPAAFKQKVEGTVVLSILVTEAGKVGDVKVLRPAGGSVGLNEAAVAAAKKWTFRPAVKAGKKVKVWITYPIVFKVQG
ncbi:TonB family protein [bacterium]|nr:TonB family protein [bacterium]